MPTESLLTVFAFDRIKQDILTNERASEDLEDLITTRNYAVFDCLDFVLRCEEKAEFQILEFL